MRVLVAGASGFLGGYLVARLLEQGCEVRAVSRGGFERWAQCHVGAQNVQLDLRDRDAARYAARGCERIYHMAAMIGGIGYLESRHADCTASVVVSSNLLEAAIEADCERFLFPSSACVYPDTGAVDAPALTERDVEPYAPRGGYGWQKLFTEQMCAAYAQQYGLQVRVPRLGTVYGPYSPLGEAEKAPIAICRKVVEAVRDASGEIEIWGDGEQTRSFLYVDDCIDALLALMDAAYSGPVNIGSAERVSINELVSVVEHVAGASLQRKYRLDAPQGVRGRVCDTTVARAVCGWQERTSLRQGIEKTLAWVREQVGEYACA